MESSEKENLELYFRQKKLLDTLLRHQAITEAQYDKSFSDMTKKMGLVGTIYHNLKAMTAELDELSMYYETAVQLFSGSDYLQEFCEFYEISLGGAELAESEDGFRGTLREVSGYDVWQPIAEKTEELFGVPKRVMVFEDVSPVTEALEGPHGCGPFFFINDSMFCEYDYYTLCFISGTNN